MTSVPEDIKGDGPKTLLYPLGFSKRWKELVKYSKELGLPLYRGDLDDLLGYVMYALYKYVAFRDRSTYLIKMDAFLSYMSVCGCVYNYGRMWVKCSLNGV